MTMRRALFGLGLLLAVLAGVQVRLYTWPFLADGDRVRAMSSDDYYHLRRARFAVAHYPDTIFFDPLMNFPSGGVPIWPPLFDIALATPARLLHGPRASAGAIERGAAYVPLVFAAGTIVLAGLLGRRLFGPRGGVVAAFFVALCLGHVFWSQYGHTDQHVAESFFGLLVLVVFLFGRDRPDGSARRYLEIATGIALAAAVLAWQGAIYWGALIALCLFLEALATGRSVLREAVVTLGLSAALVAAGTRAWLGTRTVPFTYISFGYFQPLFLASLAAGTALSDTVLRAARRQLDRRGAVKRALVLCLFAAVLLPFAGPLFAGLVRGVGYAIRRTPEELMGPGGYISYPRNWLGTNAEAQPLLAEGPGLAWKQLSAAFFLTPFVLAAWGLRAARRDRPATHILLSVWCVVTLFLALEQRMNIHYLAPLCALAALEAARWVGERTARPVLRAVAAGAVLLVLAFPMLPPLADEIRRPGASESEMQAMLAWMHRELPRAVDAYDPRLLAPSPSLPELNRASSVLAPWSLGHRLLYFAEQPVVSNNFGYGFTDGIRFFLAESEDDALAIARKHRARWVVVADLLPRMNDYARTIDRPALVIDEGRGLAATAAYFRTLQSRLFDFEGRGSSLPGGETIPPVAHFRLLYRSKTAVRRGEGWVAQWKVFEITD